MKFGINTFLWSIDFSDTQFALLDNIRAHGFDGVEIPLLRPSDFDAPKIGHAIAASGLEATACVVLPHGLSFISEDANARRAAIDHTALCIQKAAEAGIRLIAGPVYNPVGVFTGTRRTSDEWRRAVDCYGEIGPTLARYNVQLAIEPLNRFETYFLNTTSDAVALCAEIAHPNIGILWDTFHANVEEKSLGAALLETGKYLKHVHTCENDRGTPGTGHVDWDGVFSALEQLGYDGWLTIESFGFSAGDLSAAASIWRDLEKTPEEIAWRGIEFLKGRCAAMSR